ncbi:MAG TPA: cytochrome P450 [Solirubrobacteraceae bacterium]|jgi:cytochrome P450|nr:cytochrome P450 [Solirubrobacteraceae bacterium]
MAVEVPRIRSIDDLPGPPGLPLIGNALQLRGSSTRNMTFEKWAKRYGPIFRISSVGRRAVVVCGTDEVNAIMRDRADGYTRWSEQLRISREMVSTTSLVFAKGEDWKRHRRLVVTALNTNRLKQYFHVVVRSTERLHRRLVEAARDGRAFDIHRVLACYTVDITASLAFGHDLNTLERGENELQAHVHRILKMEGRRLSALIPYWRWFKLPADRALEYSLAEVDRAVTGFIEQARVRMSERPELREEPENFLEAMLSAQEADGNFADSDIAGDTLVMLEAGESATAHMLGWTVWFVASRPDVQERLAQEADEVLGERPFAGEYRTVAGLRYAEAVLRESLRLKNIVPMLSAAPDADTTISGTHIPAGTRLLLFLDHAAKQASSFPRADDFDPGRWLEDDDGELRTFDHKSFLSFGSGPRFCPGRNLTFVEARTALAMIAHNFELELDDSKGPVREDFGSAMRAPVGLSVRVRERTGAPRPLRRGTSGECPHERVSA